MAILLPYVIIGLASFYQAFLIRSNPSKVRSFRRIREQQRGPEFEQGMQKMLFANFLLTGFLWILTGLLGYFYGIKLNFLMLLLCIVGSVILLVTKWRYMGGVPAWNYALLALALVGTAFYNLWLFKDSKVEVLPDLLSIEGDYGQTIHYQSIDSVFVMETMPEVKYTKDGYSVFGNKKGLFRLNDGSDAKFYLLGKQPPFLKMYTRSGLVFVNRKTTAETEQLIEELKSKVGKKFVE